MNDKIDLRPESPHRHIDEIPRRLVGWGVAVLVIIVLALASAWLFYAEYLSGRVKV